MQLVKARIRTQFLKLSERATSIRKTQVRSPAGLHGVFLSDPALSSSIFVEKMREFDLE